MESFKDWKRKALLESGLSRIHTHLTSGKSIGIISAAQGKDKGADDDAHKNLVKRVREHGYGPIQATGRSEWGPERSLIIPNISKKHLTDLGNEFHQQAVIHVGSGGKSANLHYLKTAGDKAGSTEAIGHSHFNKPNNFGVTILKGVGFNPKDTRPPTKSFTFTEDEGWFGSYVLEALTIPPMGQLHPLEMPY